LTEFLEGGPFLGGYTLTGGVVHSINKVLVIEASVSKSIFTPIKSNCSLSILIMVSRLFVLENAIRISISLSAFLLLFIRAKNYSLCFFFFFKELRYVFKQFFVLGNILHIGVISFVIA